jgi:hypothetical protein
MRVGQRKTTGWWITSVALHLAILCGIAWFTPLRDLVFKHSVEEEQREASPERLASAVRSLHELYGRRLRDAVDQLHRLQTELHGLERKRLARLQSEEKALADAAPEALTPEPVGNLAGVPVAELYAAARGREAEFVRDLSRVRAYELTSIQQIPLSRALNATVLAPPERPELDRAALEAPITSAMDGRLAALKRELVLATQEARNMVVACERMLGLAKGVLGEDGEVGILQWEMAEATPTGSGESQYDEGKPYIGPTLLPNEIYPGQQNLLNARPAFGNKLSGLGEQADWLSISRWYIIGPFTHPGRDRPEDLDKKYPPESVLDLDAAYVGKGGRTLRWEYRQTGFVRVEPFGNQIDRYSIWYGYTEIFSERDQTLWVAFGSDDYSVAWMEGKVVWQSGKTPQPWVPFAPNAFRQVHFKQGINRMLFKLENAGGTTGFSVIVGTDPNVGG